jgi:fatty-acyl-CoA synthase
MAAVTWGDTASLTTTQAIARWARETPKALAVVGGDARVSYRQLAAHIVDTMRYLSAAGVGPGSIVGIEVGSRYADLLLILACEAIGAAHAPFRTAEITDDDVLIPHCDALWLISDRIANRPGRNILPPDVAFLNPPNASRFSEADLRALETTHPPDTVVRIARTSGTTGHARNIAMTRRMVESQHAVDDFVLGDNAARYHFVCFYLSSVTTTWREMGNTLRHGTTVVIDVARKWPSQLAEFAPCQTYLLVGDASRIADTARRNSAAPLPCALRLIGAAAPRSLWRMLAEHVASGVFSQYSMTESIMPAVMDENDLGTLLPDVEARLVDKHGDDVAPGQPGTLLVRSPRTCAGYLWDEARTRECFVDGWFRSSDICVMPEPGKIKVIGRADDTINIGGIKFLAGQVETDLRDVDGVIDAVLLNVHTGSGVSRPHAVIERLDPDMDERLSAVIAPIVGEHFAAIPTHFVTEMPRTGLGKVDRAALRDLLRQKQ